MLHFRWLFILLVSSCSHFISKRGPCPSNMALVENEEKGIRVCVAVYEYTDTSKSKIKDPSGYRPNGYMDYYACKRICQGSGGRLPTKEEWEEACAQTPPEHCNKFREHPLLKLVASSEPWYYQGQNCKMPKHLWGDCMKDPRINKLAVGLAINNDFPLCISKYGVRHMIGNLGEWVEGNHLKRGVLMGQFNGGLYPQPRSSCTYKTVAHGPSYRDYSIGCRCAKDIKDTDE